MLLPDPVKMKMKEILAHKVWVLNGDTLLKARFCLLYGFVTLDFDCGECAECDEEES